MATAEQLLDEELALEHELALERAREGLLGYVTATNDAYEVNWHHRRICMAIDAMHRGWTHRQLLEAFGIHGDELRRQLDEPHPTTGLYAGLTHPSAIDARLRSLHIAVPPRMGKSTLASMAMPAWWFGKDPNAQIISTSYSADLASRINRQVQREIDNPRYTAIFPKTRLNAKNVKTVAQNSYLRNSDLFEIVDHKGVYRSAGVAGGVTGLGASVAIVDDPVKNRDQADSQVVREGVWEWYASTLYTRLHKGAVKLLIQTRWHEDDLGGRVLAQAKSDQFSDQWFGLIYPAILDAEPTPGDPREQGEAMWPSHFPLEQMNITRATIGTYEFEALYQQRPAPREGGVIKTSWLQYYTRLPDGLTSYTMSADLTFGSRTTSKGDFVAIQVWACAGADRYLIDQIHSRMEFTEQIRALKTMSGKYPMCRLKLIEDAANGRAAISVLRSEIQGLVPVRAIGSKQARLEAISPQVEAGNVYLPSPSIAPWIQTNVHELASFPNGAHDDTIDAMVYALDRLSPTRRTYASTLPVSLKKGDAMGGYR